ncbi:MAG: penicillin-binding protein [Geobacteraceae bacterium]|nr:MAG: penicillin-binding protein [Geobacteraceae bacterium]
MRDIKHITTKKQRFKFLTGRRHSSLNAYKDLIESKPTRSRLRLILPILATVLALYPIFNLLISAKNAISSVNKNASQPAKEIKPYSELDTGQSFQLAAQSLHASRFDGNRLTAPLPDGGTIVYAIDKELQQRVTKVMEDYKVPYGVFIAIEPKTGRILAMAGHSSMDPSWEQRSFYNLYPMASLFKIITAAAALEQNKVTPDTVFAFRGRLTSENPRYWDVNPRGRNQQMALSTAMGKSVNPVFGRLASDVVGRDPIVSCVERFGFNQILFPGSPTTPSRAVTPQNDTELKLMGAGLCREVKISPLHAASIMAAIANSGVMMQPVLAQEIINVKGETVFTDNPQPVRRLVSPETAGQLARMLTTTVSSGTSRKVFHDRRGRPKLASISIAAKTGSIDGKDPAGHYSWFAAYAPANDPQIALAALVINQDKWRIKATLVGEQALEAFFK